MKDTYAAYHNDRRSQKANNNCLLLGAIQSRKLLLVVVYMRIHELPSYRLSDHEEYYLCQF